MEQRYSLGLAVIAQAQAALLEPTRWFRHITHFNRESCGQPTGWSRKCREALKITCCTKSILEEISPEYSDEGLMPKLKLQYSGHLMQRTDLLEKTLTLGKIKSRRSRGRQRREMVGWHHRLGGHEFEQVPGDGDQQGSLGCCSPWGRRSQTRLSNWTDWAVVQNSG